MCSPVSKSQPRSNHAQLARAQFVRRQHPVPVRVDFVEARVAVVLESRVHHEALEPARQQVEDLVHSGHLVSQMLRDDQSRAVFFQAKEEYLVLLVECRCVLFNSKYRRVSQEFRAATRYCF